jgi:hypothetical protein
MISIREPSLRPWFWGWALGILASWGTAFAGVSVSTAWEYREPDLRPNVLFPSSCASPGGRLLVLASANERPSGTDAGVLLTPDGKAQRFSFPTVSGREDRLMVGMACQWVH